VGAPVLLLDFLKGAAPVALAQAAGGLSGLGLAAAAAAPILGHIFSPFLGLKGGKGIAAAFGVWTGLVPGAGPLVLGLTMGLGLLLRLSHARALFAGLLALLAFLLLKRPDPALLLAWAATFALLAYSHRRELISSLPRAA
jgi:glycerol-3-phosphate acyltransferase PlsY